MGKPTTTTSTKLVRFAVAIWCAALVGCVPPEVHVEPTFASAGKKVSLEIGSRCTLGRWIWGGWTLEQETASGWVKVDDIRLYEIDELARHAAEPPSTPAPVSSDVGGLGEICKLDPSACPAIDLERAASRPLSPIMFTLDLFIEHPMDRRIRRVTLPRGLPRGTYRFRILFERWPYGTNLVKRSLEKPISATSEPFVVGR